MPRYAVFSYTPNRNSRNSAELHRTDFHGNEAVAEYIQDELEERGHNIVACLKVGGHDDAASGRRSVGDSDVYASGRLSNGRNAK